MGEILGEELLRSSELEFNHTDYYEAEMGERLRRIWVGYKKPANPADLADWKLAAKIIEKELAEGGRRRVNIDPGAVGLPRVILASLKDHAHRFPLKSGVFGQLELLYRGDSWSSLPWSYPDYSSEIAGRFFTRCRDHLHDYLTNRGIT